MLHVACDQSRSRARNRDFKEGQISSTGKHDIGPACKNVFPRKDDEIEQCVHVSFSERKKRADQHGAIFGQNAIVQQYGERLVHNRVNNLPWRAVRIDNAGDQNIGIDNNSHPDLRFRRAASISALIVEREVRSRPRLAAWPRILESAC